MGRPKGSKSRQVLNNEKELEALSKYDYNLRAERMITRVYLHTAGIIGIVFTLLGLTIFVAIPAIIGVGLTVLGAFICIAAFYFERKLAQVK